MGLTIPPELDAVLELAGLWFPNIDEDEMRADAAAARVVEAGTSLAALGAGTAMRDASAAYRGDSATALAGYWGDVGTGDGHLAQSSSAARMSPVWLEHTATVVTGAKVAVGTVAAVGAVRLAMALLSGGPFAGASATASLLATRHAGMKVLREAGEGSARILAPALRRRVTEPMQRILDNLRRPGGGPTPAFAGAGGRGLARPHTVGPRASSGPRDVRDGMAAMGRSNNNARRGGNGRRGGGGRGRGGGKQNSTDGTTGHAADRQAQRGISDDMVEQAKQNGRKRPGNQPGTTVHETDSVRVVTNKSGGIISAMWKRKK
ncbi:DUF4258 domain-containing protein [Nonomuraea lactucae]|uniref:DUF4258 domain-containing protein n=1 Tax=Nonomuraea lactucae TaxID=2249762 RepID=UPI000DE3D742|nr:DUF4258 domain-containing protein [Nonomuraea lactucae]